MLLTSDESVPFPLETEQVWPSGWLPIVTAYDPDVAPKVKLLAPDATDIVVLPFCRMSPEVVRFVMVPLRICVELVEEDELDETELPPPPPPQAVSNTARVNELPD
jgi:hypothetical protein